MMGEKLFGTYEGKQVYQTDLQTYIFYKRYEDDENIYLINGDLIYQNRLFARWDGKQVHEWDIHEQSVYYRHKIRKPAEPEPELESEPEREYIEPVEDVVEENYDVAAINAVTEQVKSVDELLEGVYAWELSSDL